MAGVGTALLLPLAVIAAVALAPMLLAGMMAAREIAALRERAHGRMRSSRAPARLGGIAGAPAAVCAPARGVHAAAPHRSPISPQLMHVILL